MVKVGPQATVKIILTSLLSLGTPSADAIVRLGLQANLATVNSRNLTEAETGSELVGDVFFMAQLQRESKYYVTLGYLATSSIVPISETSTSSFTSANFYGGLTAFFNDGYASVGAFVAPFVQGEYSEGDSDPEVWGGSAFMLRFAGHSQLTEHLFLDLSISYYGASFVNRSAESPVSEVDSFSQSIIIPMIGFQFFY